MINRTALRVALMVGLFGLIVSRKTVLEWVAGQSPLESLVVWYAIFGIFISILGYSVFNMAWNPRYTVALLIVTFALGIVLYWPVSGYSTQITGAHLTGVEAATEDGIVYNALLSIGIHDSTGIITYAIVPFLLILISAEIIAPSLFGRIFRAAMGRA